MNPKVLVVGGAGYVGSHTCKALAASGYDPVTYDNLYQGHTWAVRWGELIVGNLFDRPLLRETLRTHDIAAVLHFAAHAYVGESMQHPSKYFHNNVAGTLSLLDCMLEAGVPVLVFSSSCAVYGEPQALPMMEAHPLVPINPYGESKLMVERILRWYGSVYGLRHASLRYFNAAGADASGHIGERHNPETHLLPLAIEAALGRRGPLDLFGTDYPTADGTAVRDYVHVTDLAEAHCRALTRLLRGEAGGAYNLGTGKGHSVQEVIDAVVQVGARSVAVETQPRRPGDPATLVAAPGEAARALGWEPRQSSLHRIVESAWHWHENEP